MGKKGRNWRRCRITERGVVSGDEGECLGGEKRRGREVVVVVVSDGRACISVSGYITITTMAVVVLISRQVIGYNRDRVEMERL